MMHSSKDLSWPFWPIVPLYPYGKRKTICQEIIKDTIWTFEQLQGIFYVIVPIRMTIIRLEEGGLLVYAPVAPTPECVRLINELVTKYGEIKYIILPTISGVEHKVFVAPFARKFPTAQIFVAPHQWSFPLNLPLSWLGLPKKRTQILPNDPSKTPFVNEFDYQILGEIDLGIGSFEEVVFYHKKSATLLVTDLIISIPENPPKILEIDPYPLLFHAKENAFDVVENNPENRRKGWQRISLFACYFQPSALKVVTLKETIKNALKAPDRSKKAYFGLFPFGWQKDWQKSFNQLRKDGKILVAPILQTLILNRVPKETLAWVDQLTKWNFKRIIPCHFDSPINTNTEEFKQAFTFLKNQNLPQENQILPDEDLNCLKQIDENLCQLNLIPRAKPKI